MHCCNVIQIKNKVSAMLTVSRKLFYGFCNGLLSFMCFGIHNWPSVLAVSCLRLQPLRVFIEVKVRAKYSVMTNENAPCIDLFVAY